MADESKSDAGKDYDLILMNRSVTIEELIHAAVANDKFLDLLRAMDRTHPKLFSEIIDKSDEFVVTVELPPEKAEWVAIGIRAKQVALAARVRGIDHSCEMELPSGIVDSEPLIRCKNSLVEITLAKIPQAQEAVE